MSIIDDLRQSVIDGEMNTTQELVQKTLAEKIPPEQILSDGLISAMTEVGRRFECNEFYVPEMLISARAMKSGLALLRPHLPMSTRLARLLSERYRVTCTILERIWSG